MSSQQFNLHKQTEGRIVTLTPVGPLDPTLLRRLVGAVVDVCREQPAHVLLDLGKITFIDRAGVQTILKCGEIFKEHDCGFWVMPPRGRMRRDVERFGVLDALPVRA